MFLRVPHDEVVIVEVVFISVASEAGAFAYRPEGDFSLHADFMQEFGYFAARGRVYLQTCAFMGIEQVLVCRECVNFLLETGGGGRGIDGLHVALVVNGLVGGEPGVPEHHARESQVV